MITFLFGAGASFGCGDNLCTPFNPPLGNQLFHHLEQQGGAFANISSSLKTKFIKSFEEGMLEVPNTNTSINPLQRELAVFLSQFQPKAGNAYKRLLGRLSGPLKNNKITIATLNYDLLIEHTLAELNVPFSYNKGNSTALLKPHGSSNFLPDLGGLNLRNNVFENCGAWISGLPINAANSHLEVKRWCQDTKNRDISPLLCLYRPDKKAYINPELISKIQEEYAEAIQESSLVVIIGTAYIPHDVHIWAPLTKSNATILIVDPYPSSSIQWAQENGKTYKVIQKGFYDAVRDIQRELTHYRFSI